MKDSGVQEGLSRRYEFQNSQHLEMVFKDGKE